MRLSPLIATLSLVLCGSAYADTVTFIPLQTLGVQLGKISGNGAYAVGGTAAEGFRWTAGSGAEELIPELDVALGINNAGTIAGAVPVNGGVNNNGDDLAAYAPVGGTPVQLTPPLLQADANGYDIADDGTVVGLSFGHAFTGSADAFVWTAAAGMSTLPVHRPANYSRANVISADGHVIAGWNDQDDGNRTAVIWQDRVPLDVVDLKHNPVGEADGISSNGQYVVGGNYTDINGNTGSWRWNRSNGAVELIAGMNFAFGVSDDGKTVVGSTGFFDPVPRAALVWQQGIGTMKLVDYLTAQGVTLPAGWDPNLAGGFAGISGDGSLMGGWSGQTAPPFANQSYIIRTVRDHIFTDGFDGP